MKTKPTPKKTTAKTTKPLHRRNTGMKQSSRASAQAKQQEISRLQYLASHEKYLPPKRTSDQKQQERDRFNDLQERAGVDVSKKAFALVHAGEISLAQLELNKQYESATRDALAGVETGNLLPLCHHLSLIGPTLLAEPRLVPYLHNLWLDAKTSLVDAQRLKAVLKALKPGKGKLGDPNPEREQQERRIKQQKRRDAIRDYKEALDNLLKNNPSALKKCLADWTHGKDTLRKTAAKEWKERKKRELR